MGLADRIVTLHRALRDDGVPHAFGGALALAWCTQRARATIDIDINLFVSVDAAADVLESFPAGVRIADADRRAIARDGQTRLWWEGTPVDVFFNTTPFHDDVADRRRFERFDGEDIPFLSCVDLAVFKAFFDRTKDWADLEEMAAGGTLDAERVVGVLATHLGPGDPRVDRVLDLARRFSA